MRSLSCSIDGVRSGGSSFGGGDDGSSTCSKQHHRRNQTKIKSKMKSNISNNNNKNMHNKQDEQEEEDNNDESQHSCYNDRKRRDRQKNNKKQTKRLRHRKYKNNKHDRNNEYDYKRENNNSDGDDDNDDDRRITRYLQRFHKGIIVTATAAASTDDNVNSSSSNNNTNNSRRSNKIIMKNCLKKLLLSGAGIEEMSSCLFLASSSGDVGAVTLILEQITKWNKYHKKKKKKRKKSSRKNNTSMIIDIDDLINNGSTTNSDATTITTTSNNSSSLLTPLHIACLLNNGAMACLLVQYGADEYARDANGDTPIGDLGLTELINQHENDVVYAEANARANQRDWYQQQELRSEQTEKELAWAERLADADAQDQMQHGIGLAVGGGESSEQKWGQGWKDDVTNDVLHEAGGCSDGDWWSRIAKERQQKRRSSAETATAAAAAAATSSKKRFHSNISDSSESKNESHKRKETTDGNGIGIENKVPSTSTVIEIDPVEARAIDNRAWSAFIEKWSVGFTKTRTPITEVASSPLPLLAEQQQQQKTDETVLPLWAKDDPIMQKKSMMTVTDVPWPSAGDDAPFPGSSVLTHGERKVYHRQLLRRWHPDKFTQRFSSRLVEEDRVLVLKRVTAVFQSININNSSNNNNGTKSSAGVV